LKPCGQRFWEFISGRTELYTEIIEPLGSRAKERKEEFEVELARVTNRLTKEFLNGFCQPDGSIQWKKLLSLIRALFLRKGVPVLLLLKGLS
jgi:hypothetical protein